MCQNVPKHEISQFKSLGTIHKLRRSKGMDGPFRQKTTFDVIDGGAILSKDGGTILSKDDVVF